MKIFIQPSLIYLFILCFIFSKLILPKDIKEIVLDDNDTLKTENICSEIKKTNQVLNPDSSVFLNNKNGTSGIDLSGLIIVDGEKDEFYNSLTGPSDGYIQIRSYANNENGSPVNDADLSAKVWTAWDNDWFYLYEEVMDDTLSANAANVWEEDEIELKFDPQPTDSVINSIWDTRLTLFAANEPGVINSDDMSTILSENKQFARKIIPNGYALELAIKWSAIGHNNPEVNESIVPGVNNIFGLAINQHDNDGYARRQASIMWAAELHDSVWNTPKYCGTVKFLTDNKLQFIAKNNVIGITNLISYNGSDNKYYYPSTLSINQNISFGDIKNKNNFKIIGIPGNSSIQISMAGEYQYDWRVFWDNGNNQNYLEESANFSFSPGKAYWVLCKDPININQLVNSVQLDNTNTFFSIPLHPGWNLISTPFEISTKWESIAALNGLSNQLIYSWNGGYYNPYSMKPYEGYYFNNTGNLPSLKIPYEPYGTLGKLSVVSDYPIDIKKCLRLSVCSPGKEMKSEVFIGFNPASKDVYDENDYYSAPGDFQEVWINLIRKELPLRDRYFFIEQRPSINEGQEYDLEIKAIPNQTMQFGTQGTENFNGYEIYLIDTLLKNIYDLKENKEIQLTLAHQYNHFKLYIGTYKYLEGLKQNNQLLKYGLYQNYPNPFNPKTIIRFSIAEAERVTLKVFNTIGQEIKTLLNCVQYEAGNYEVEFDGKDLSSGIYIVRMDTDKFTNHRKMILLK
jgi:hypothetical protein